MKNVPENAVAWLNDTTKEIYATKESLFVDGVEYKPINSRVDDPVKVVVYASLCDYPEGYINETLGSCSYKLVLWQ